MTRTSLNQGVFRATGFINEENLNPAGSWSLGLLQMDFFYRKRPWYAGQFVRKIVPKVTIPPKSILFFQTILNAQKPLLKQVLVRNVDKTFSNAIVYLPQTAKGKIDFTFMEEFIQRIEESRVSELQYSKKQKINAYLQAAGLTEFTLNTIEEKYIQQIPRLKWKEFEIGELFEIATGRDIIIGKTKPGPIPLISHQHKDNGITSTIEQIPNRRLFNYKKTISLADRGVFLASCQNEDYQIGTRVKALEFKNGEQSKNVRLFFVTSINKLQVLFTDYSQNATDSLPQQKIYIPTKKGVPDFAAMEVLINAAQKLAIKDVVDDAERSITATKQVIGINK